MAKCLKRWNINKGSRGVFGRFGRAVLDGSVDAIVGGLVVVAGIISMLLLAAIWFDEINQDKEKLRDLKPGIRLVEARYPYSLDCSIIHKKELELSTGHITIVKPGYFGGKKTIVIPYLDVNNIVFKYGVIKAQAKNGDINKLIIRDEKTGKTTFCLKDAKNLGVLKDYIYGVYNSASGAGGEGGAKGKEQARKITLSSEGEPRSGKSKAGRRSDDKADKSDEPANIKEKKDEEGGSPLTVLLIFILVCLVSLYFSMASSDVWKEQIELWKERWHNTSKRLKKLKGRGKLKKKE